MALLLGLVLAMILAPTSAAAGMGERGGDGTQLVWSRAMDTTGNTFQLVISDSNGQRVRELTHPAEGVLDIDARISPNGKLVVFERDSADGGGIFIIGTDGRGEREFNVDCTDPCAGTVAPTWAPDGSHVVFTLVIGPFDGVNGSARSAVLWSADLRGQHLTRLSEPGIDGALEDYHASFAPDGYLVFTRMRNSDITPAIFRMNPGGTHVRQLTPWEIRADSAQVSPAKSGPSHNLVVFEATPTAGQLAVATTSAVGGPPKTLPRINYLTSTTVPTIQNFYPTWSPDGGHIAFVRFEAGPAVVGDIWTMRWNGRNPKPLTQSPLFEYFPAWGLGHS